MTLNLNLMCLIIFHLRKKTFLIFSLNEFFGLTNQLNYRQVYYDQTFNLYKNRLTNQEIANNIAQFASNQQKIIMTSLRAASNVFLSLTKNPTLQEFFHDSRASITYFYIKFTKNDRVVFTYEENNQQLWAKPKFENDLYYFGYLIPHKLKIWLDWFGGYISIAWQFTNLQENKMQLVTLHIMH